MGSPCPPQQPCAPLSSVSQVAPRFLKSKSVRSLRPCSGTFEFESIYVGVNRADLLQRMGVYPPPPGVSPDIPGLEYMGEIDALGPSASRFKVGDRVYGVIGGGAYAEFVTVHEREVVAVPDGVDSEVAAAVPEAFCHRGRRVARARAACPRRARSDSRCRQRRWHSGPCDRIVRWGAGWSAHPAP